LDYNFAKKEITRLVESVGEIKESNIQYPDYLRDVFIRRCLFKESIEQQDYETLRDIIRTELALVFFDLFKKRSVWRK